MPKETFVFFFAVNLSTPPTDGGNVTHTQACLVLLCQQKELPCLLLITDQISDTQQFLKLL